MKIVFQETKKSFVNSVKNPVNFVKKASLLLGLAVSLLLGGCAGMQPNGDVQQFHLIVTKRADYYKTSPDQPTPPDGRLDEGTRIRVLSMNGEHAKVETTYGLVVWISANDIGPAPTNTYQPTGG